jgi:uncharacterized protein YukJ
MPLKDPYGVLKGTIVDKLDSVEAKHAFPKGKPHYQVKVDAGGEIYRIAVNVKSDVSPPNLQVFRSDNYKHPMLEHFESYKTGFTHLQSTPDSGALDFIRQNLFDMSQLTILPADGDPSGNDMNDIFNIYVKQAMDTEGALVYAFGGAWDDGKTDQYFGFPDGKGIHEIHMNQGNVPPDHDKDNGVYQDGAFFIYYPDEKRYIAVFCKFQSQVVHTDDASAAPITNPAGVPVTPETDTPVVITAALVNPRGVDTGKERVYLLNTTDETIDLDGWVIVDKANNRDVLSGVTIGGGDVFKYTLKGNGAQLSNKGGTISLLNKEGLKVSGVSYTADDAKSEGRIVQF